MFDNDGTLWTERPVYAQLLFALDRAAELGHPATSKSCTRRGMAALMPRGVTHAGIDHHGSAHACRSWLATTRHPASAAIPQTVYQPMLSC